MATRNEVQFVQMQHYVVITFTNSNGDVAVVATA